jgi:NAD(P) transhydrogenase
VYVPADVPPPRPRAAPGFHLHEGTERLETYDLIVIGTGPSGQRAAIQAAKLGRRVAITERRTVVGGVCLNTGTVPSKSLREAVLYLSGIRQRDIYGASYSLKSDITIEDLLTRTNHVIRNEVEVIRAQMKRNRVELIEGAASFTGPHTVAVEGAAERREIEGRFVVIATGSSPAPPPGVAIDGRQVIDSDGILTLERLPREMIVVGAGVIGCEYACIFGVLGVKVTLVDARAKLLDFVDEEIVENLIFHMRSYGVTFRLGDAVSRVEVQGPDRVIAHLESGKSIFGETVLYSAGRVGNTASLNLAAAGLQADERGRLKVDEKFRTAVPHIYAVGDVIGFPALASTSAEQGRLAACHAFHIRTQSVPELFPFGIYTIPEISMVGPGEAELTKNKVPYEVGRSYYREIARGQIIGDVNGMLKLLFHSDSLDLLSVHVIGEGATELVHTGQAVIAFGGTIQYFARNVFNYPTLGECYKVAALDGINKHRTLHPMEDFTLHGGEDLSLP